MRGRASDGVYGETPFFRGRAVGYGGAGEGGAERGAWGGDGRLDGPAEGGVASTYTCVCPYTGSRNNRGAVPDDLKIGNGVPWFVQRVHLIRRRGVGGSGSPLSPTPVFWGRKWRRGSVWIRGCVHVRGVNGIGTTDVEDVPVVRRGGGRQSNGRGNRQRKRSGVSRGSRLKFKSCWTKAPPQAHPKRKA